jgi:hypothetical protein
MHKSVAEGQPEAEKAKKPSDLTELELRRVLLLSEVTAFTTLSADSLKRNHSDKILRLGPRRLGMRLADVLAIGDAVV